MVHLLLLTGVSGSATGNKVAHRYQIISDGSKGKKSSRLWRFRDDESCLPSDWFEPAEDFFHLTAIEARPSSLLPDQPSYSAPAADIPLC